MSSKEKPQNPDEKIVSDKSEGAKKRAPKTAPIHVAAAVSPLYIDSIISCNCIELYYLYLYHYCSALREARLHTLTVGYLRFVY